MKNFILTEHPNFGEEKVNFDGTIYHLAQVKGNGCCLTVIDEATGIERDRICLSKTDMKALFVLLSVGQ